MTDNFPTPSILSYHCLPFDTPGGWYWMSPILDTFGFRSPIINEYPVKTAMYTLAIKAMMIIMIIFTLKRAVILVFVHFAISCLSVI